MKHYWDYSSKILLAHLLVQCFAMPIVIFVFGSFLTNSDGGVNNFACFLIGIACSIGYIINVYSRSYKLGVRDTKSYSEYTPKWYNGFIFSVPAAVLSVISAFSVMYFEADTSTVFAANLVSVYISKGAPAIVYLITYFWNFSFFGFKLSWAAYFVIAALLPLVSGFFGYFAGMKRFEFGAKFFSKLVYKK